MHTIVSGALSDFMPWSRKKNNFAFPTNFTQFFPLNSSTICERRTYFFPLTTASPESRSFSSAKTHRTKLPSLDSPRFSCEIAKKASKENKRPLLLLQTFFRRYFVQIEKFCGVPQVKKAFFQSLSEVFVTFVVEKICSSSVKLDSVLAFPLVEISSVVCDQVFEVGSFGVHCVRLNVNNRVPRHAVIHLLT